jgi:hypothetical protein
MVDLTQTFKADLSAMSADQVLDHLINLRKIKADLEASDAKALNRLDELAEAGEIDQGGFSHNDWLFSWSAGRRNWVYPEAIKTLEAQTKAAKKAAEADGTATATTGAPFWTIKPPKS